MSPPFARIVFIVISEFIASLTFIHFYFSLYITVFLLHQSKQALMQIILLLKLKIQQYQGSNGKGVGVVK